MSRHNISTADVHTAGAGIAFNLPEEYQNALRGMPIFHWTVESFPGGSANADVDGVAESQQPALGGQQDLVLNGAYVDANGVAQLPYCTQVTITWAGADAGRTATILGTDANGRPQANEIPGANGATTSTNKHFLSVDRIFVDDDTAGVITVGNVAVGGLGLRMRAVTLPGESTPLRLAGFGLEGGPPEIGLNFTGGTSDAQTATNGSPRASYTRSDENQPVNIFYVPDLTKEGVGENYTDPSQTPSPY